MSVINKMLSDLDSRGFSGPLPARIRESFATIARDTVSLSNSGGAVRRRGSLGPGIVWAFSLIALLLAGAAGTWWYLNQAGLLERKGVQAKLVSPPVMTPPVIRAVPARELVAATNPLPVIVNLENEQAKVAIKPPLVVAKLPQETSGTVRAEIPQKLDSTLKAGPSPTKPSEANTTSTPRAVPDRPRTEQPVALAPAPPPPTAAVTGTQNSQRRSIVLEALSQAQGLWNSGSRQLAIDVLSEALGVAERANSVGAPSVSHSELILLVRELARMDLSEGQPGKVLEILTRLEPALSDSADVWAIRGNAAQRLGRHQLSAEAYLMALKLRPGEPRWMLGAAVSLAAQGQTASAAEFAEKARVGGVLSPEVATYLEQLGVSLRQH